MYTYKEYEKFVFDGLMKKNSEDPNFTFALRQKSAKGAELNYFIGTEKSKYFGTTFWTIPSGYPGSAMHLIDVFFTKTGENKYNYFIKFNQTKTPHDKQNKSALNLIRNLRPKIKVIFESFSESSTDNKMESYSIKNTNTDYVDVDILLDSLYNDLVKLLPIVEEEIKEEKKSNKKFIAHRITTEEFNNFLTKLNLRFEKYGNKSTVAITVDNNVANSINSLNKILFGPPGTGKTYNSINKALKIINEKEEQEIDWENREKVKKLFDKRIEEGRIVFTTFHQSMSYEDFIEGIKPVEPEKDGDPVNYKIQLGIFRKLCIEAAFEIAQLRNNNKTENVLDFSILYDSFVEEIEEKLIKGDPVPLETKSGGTVFVDSISQQGNIIIKHHNGTRLYTVSKARLTKLQSKIIYLDEVSNINDEFREIIGGSNSSAYWSVLNAIKKIKPLNVEKIESRGFTFEEKKDVVQSLSKSDFNNKNGKPYIIIIDEINRGNVSQIFGELISLIEEDKRLGKKEALEAILPYSKEKFGVPPNLYIIGTMNTADRSVEALDTALRRRFSFEEMMPKTELISPQRKIWELWWKYPNSDWEDVIYKKEETNLFELLGIENDIDPDEKIWNKMEIDGKLEIQINYFDHVKINGINPEILLSTINKRLEKLLNKDHQIGHSYFMNVASFDGLKEIFQNNILPLLQEYFFGDFGKIGLVLGSGFFEPFEKLNENIFAEFDDDYDVSALSEKPIYTLKNILTLTNDEFINALRILLKK